MVCSFITDEAVFPIKRDEMLAYYQKYYKQLNLILVALVGLCCGLLSGAIIEASIPPAVSVRPSAATVIAPIEIATSVADLNLILQRNIFDPAGRTDLTYNAEMLPSDVATKEIVAPLAINMVLVGTVVAADRSLALIQVDGELDLYRIGENFADGSTLETVTRNRVEVRLRDKRLIELFVAENNLPFATAASQASASAVSSGVRQIDDTHWLVSREEVDKARTNFSTELRLAQMLPRIVDGQTDGFLIRSLRRQSILNKLGLKRGDVVMSVNGLALDSPEKALQIFQQLREARQIELAVERQGTAMNFAYELD
jgi:general secretion pathway protein C